MTVKSIVRGVTVGATVGTVCYMMSKATSKQKHDIRKNAGKAVKAASKRFTVHIVKKRSADICGPLFSMLEQITQFHLTMESA